MALFEKIATMKRRTVVKLCAYTLAVILVLVGTTVMGFKTAAEYKVKFETDYRRSLAGLSEHLNNIETSLTKSIYSGTSKGLSQSANALYSEAGAAKVCLSELPSSATQLDTTYKFLSQVGDYSLYLSNKLTSGGSIDEKERKNLSTLAGYASTVNASIGEMEQTAVSEGIMTDIFSIINSGDEAREKAFGDNLKSVEDSFTDYPTLLYDGPFADNILGAKSSFLPDKEKVTVRTAFDNAAVYSGSRKLTYKGEQQGQIPCYIFDDGQKSVGISQRGGYLCYLLNSRDIGEKKLSYGKAVDKAREYVNSLNLGEFKESYYVDNDGVCVVNFAYTEKEITCYSDLIKVGVALDNGEILSCSTSGYLMNHRDRNFSEPECSIESAESVLSPLLSVKGSKKAIIPLPTQKEVLCYEFLCSGEKGREILVYINSDTLQEEEILIVLKTDGGTLTI